MTSAAADLARGGDVTLFDADHAVSTRRVDLTQPLIISAGHLDVVQTAVGEDDHSYLIDPTDVARLATARR